MLIGFCVYRQRTQRNATFYQIEGTSRQEVSETQPPPRSRQSSVMSIYDEIEMYQQPGRKEASGLSTAYTVLTRDPYAYELYGLQRIAILLDQPAHEENQTESKEGTNARAWASLPIGLNQVADQDKRCLEDQVEYIDMLPNRLEVNTNGGICTNVGFSKSMNDVIGFRKANKDMIKKTWRR